MFAGGGQVDITYLDHLVNLHLVLDDRQLGKVAVVQTTKDFLHVHLGNTSWRLDQAIVTQVKAQHFHDLGEAFFDGAQYFERSLVL